MKFIRAALAFKIRAKKNQTWILDTESENYPRTNITTLNSTTPNQKLEKGPILIHLLYDPLQGIQASQDKDWNKTINDMTRTPKCNVALVVNFNVNVIPSWNKNLNFHSGPFIQKPVITPSFESYDMIQIRTMYVDIAMDDTDLDSCVQSEKLANVAAVKPSRSKLIKFTPSRSSLRDED